MEERTFDNLEDRLNFISFRQELLFRKDEVNEILFENQVSRDEYHRIMDLMDSYRDRLAQGQKVNHGEFESEIYSIVPHLNGDYHFCEMLTKAFCDDSRWDEVFPALYGGLAKYKSGSNVQ